MSPQEAHLLWYLSERALAFTLRGEWHAVFTEEMPYRVPDVAPSLFCRHLMVAMQSPLGAQRWVPWPLVRWFEERLHFTC